MVHPRASRVRLVLGWLVIFVALAVVLIEIAGRSFAERVVEDQVRAAGVAGDVEVTIGRSWWQPSITGVLLFDSLDQIDIRLVDARLYSTRVEEADYRLSDLGLDLSLRQRTVRVDSVGSGSVRVLIDPSVISVVLGGDASIRGGRLYLSDSKRPVEVGMDGTNLVVSGAGVNALVGSETVSVPVVDSQILPCNPEVDLVGRFVELKCRGSRLPGVLATSIGATSAGGRSAGRQPERDLPPIDESELTPPASIEIAPTTVHPNGDGG